MWNRDENKAHRERIAIHSPDSASSSPGAATSAIPTALPAPPAIAEPHPRTRRELRTLPLGALSQISNLRFDISLSAGSNQPASNPQNSPREPRQNSRFLIESASRLEIAATITKQRTKLFLIASETATFDTHFNAPAASCCALTRDSTRAARCRRFRNPEDGECSRKQRQSSEFASRCV